MADAQCIYCMEFKPPSSYLNAEHVLPKSFGGFADALTLHGVVCDDCNRLFGETLDRELARGSMDGIDRVHLGGLPASKIRHLGKATPRVDRVQDGPLKGLRLTPQAGPSGELEWVPLPQLGFLKPPSEEREWRLLDELPTMSEAAELGLSTSEVLAMGVDGEELARLDSSGTPREAIPGGYRDRISIVTTQDFDAQFFRAIAKIGMNYAAWRFGAGIVRGKPFDKIRRFILHGEKAFYDWWKAYRVPPLDLRNTLGHLVGAFWDQTGPCLIAFVSFHSRRTYRVRLSDGEMLLGPSMNSRHLYDLSTKKVQQMTELIALTE